MTRPASIPTLGFPSQKDAIIALYELRIEPKAIAAQTGAPINSVHRSIHDYRVATGRFIEPVRAMKPSPHLPRETWSDSAYERRLAAHQRAVNGARETRKALEAAGL